MKKNLKILKNSKTLFNSGFTFSNFLRKLYSTSKNVIQRVWLSNEVFPDNFNLFKEKIYYSGHLKSDQDYSVIVKIRIGEIYRSVGKKQTHFKFNSINDSSFEMLFEVINDRLEHLFLFPSDNSIDYTSYDSLLLEFHTIYVDDEMKRKSLIKMKNKLEKKDFEVVKKTFNYFGDSLLEVNGNPLNFLLKDDMLEINYIKKLEGFDMFTNLFLNKLKSGDKDYFLNNDSKIYLVSFNNKFYIVILNIISENEVNKHCYNRFAQLISKCNDVITEEGNLRRESGNIINIFNSCNDLLMTEKIIGLNGIKNDKRLYNKKKNEKISSLPNENIGVLDIETYEDDSLAKCFAIGFYTTINQKCTIFYIEEDLDSVKLMKNCFDELLRPKYKDITFYVHNLGRYDGHFIPKVIAELNNKESDVENHYDIDAINRNSELIRIIIKKKVDGKVRTIKLNDSIAILPRSLRDLCRDYNLETIKGYFPYRFCNKKTLFYIGNTPDISYYEIEEKKDKLENDNKERNEMIKWYEETYKNNWNLKQECIKYLEKDLLSLHEVLVKVCRTLHFLFNIQMVENLTVSGLSMSIFLNKYYNKDNPIPLINSRKMFNDIHNAYYGGRVEVYNPIPESGSYYYDVNSLYPFASLSPLPGINCIFREYFLQKPILSELFGFYYCKIKAPNIYLGLLPMRTENGTLCFPLGKWEGWYFSEELKFCEENGYEIEIIKGYDFNKVNSVFDNFVNDIYKIKSNPANKTEKNVAKLILNSLIGRFGMDFYKSVTKLVNWKEHNYLSTTRILRDSKIIDDNIYLDCYVPSINKEVCDEFGVDFIKALNNERYEELKDVNSFKNVSITTAAAVLSYARIHMAKIMLYIINNGGKIYYHDTDSIVTNIKLPDDLVHQNDLGKFKLEHIIKEGLFIADKTYYIIPTEGKVVKKAKGVKSWSLTYDDYIKMYNMNVVNATKISSVKNISKGSVVIKRKDDVKLDVTTYHKRDRIFENGKWVGTKAIIINSDKDIE